MKENINNFTSLDDVLKEKLKNSKVKEAYDYEDFFSQIAIEIVRLREKNKMSQKDIAELMHTTQQTISRIERAEENITLKTLNKFAKIFHKKVQLKFV
ncbi:MAG: helix-turn-helix transcriptional regulator [Candidatus Firestonebacteria bacterium]